VQAGAARGEQQARAADILTSRRNALGFKSIDPDADMAPGIRSSLIRLVESILDIVGYWCYYVHGFIVEDAPLNSRSMLISWYHDISMLPGCYPW
jgi:hypothetical protein